MGERPKSFRLEIPTRVKLEVLVRQEGKCSTCKEKLPREIDFDHVPALAIRAWDADQDDTIPPANDPNYIFAKCRHTCHKTKTHGTRATTAGSDANVIARVRAKEKRERETTEEYATRVLGRASIVEIEEIPLGTVAIPSTLIKREFLIGPDPKPKRSKMRGQGFRTNRDGEFKKKMDGTVVRRKPRVQE